MIENSNFPWYLQQSNTFTSLYYGFFPVAQTASCLALGNALNVNEMFGRQLFNIGTYWGMSGSTTVYDGLIYNVDEWSVLKTWTGGVKEMGEALYRSFIKAKMYAYGRVFSLDTLKKVFDIVFPNNMATVTITETDMAITINITASRELITSFIEMRAFDIWFIGKPIGIKITWEYNYTD